MERRERPPHRCFTEQQRHEEKSDCRRQQRRHSHFSSSSIFSPSSSTLLIFCFVLLVQTSSCALPSQCNQPPPPHNCPAANSFSIGYYFNSSSSQRCLSWINWGCPGGHLFDTRQECLDTCNITESTPWSSANPIHSSTPPGYAPSSSSSSSSPSSPSSSSSTSSSNPHQTPTPTPDNSDPTHPPVALCRVTFRNYPCGNLDTIPIWFYDWKKKRCIRTQFFHNCLQRTVNMHNTEDECIAMCGRFSPSYSTSISPSSPSSQPSRPTPLKTTVLVEPPLPASPTPTPEVPTLATEPPPTTLTTSSEDDKTQSEESRPTTSLTELSTDGPSSNAMESPSTSSFETESTEPEVATNLKLTQESVQLTAFDMASIGVGVLIIVLISLMVIVLVTFVYRRRKMMMGRQDHHQQTSVVKSATNPCKPLNTTTNGGNGVHCYNDDIAYSPSPSTSSSYCV